jgi:hypothetical protein
MRVRSLVRPLALLAIAVNACAPAAPAPSGSNAGTQSTVAAAPGGANGDGGASGAAPTGLKSTCAPSQVVLAPPRTTAIRSGAYVKNIVGADLNRDGKADVIVLEDKGLEVFLGKGDGTFEPAIVYDDNVGNGSALALADFDGDGQPDLLYGSFPTGELVDNYVAMRSGRPDGTFATPKVTDINANNLTQLSAADLNGDGKVDFAFEAGENPEKSGIVLNNGDGFAGPSNSLDLHGGWVLGDVTGDGATDVVLPNGTRDASGICVQTNDGKGRFSAPVCIDVPAIEGLTVNRTAIGDVNGDGVADLAAVYDESSGIVDGNNVSIFLGKGQGKFGDRIPAMLQKDMLAVHLADMNNDGKADFVAFASSSDAASLVEVLVGKGDGTMTAPPQEYPAGRNQGGGDHPLVLADFSGNGLRGIVVQNSAKNGFDAVTASCSK